MKISISSTLLLLIASSWLCCKTIPQNSTKKEGHLIEKTAIAPTSWYADKVEIWEITYLVDSLKIGGYIVLPTETKAAAPFPVIIYNRGGNKNFGAIREYQLDYLCYLASKGYAVFASQYRGNSFSDGDDQFGGDDLTDILALINIAEKEPYADANRIGLLGFSRGGMMTYQIARMTDDIKAIAVIGAPSDQFLICKDRPRMYTNVLRPLVGDSVSHRQNYINRSAIFWADEIDEPTLILHGEHDTRVNILHAERLAAAMDNYGKNVAYHIIKGGDHSLRLNSEMEDHRDRLILDWFEKYLVE